MLSDNCKDESSVAGVLSECYLSAEAVLSEVSRG